MSKKKQLLQSKVNLATVPLSYRSNTGREAALLDYSEHFRRQFIQLYPSHPPLNLCPFNECNIRKFLPTSIKPLLLPFPDLYDLQPCASFVSDFLSYLPLDDPNLLPDLLPSLTSITLCRAGDCLDSSTLLCSLLRGAGYHALVVQGRADRWVCQADQSHLPCPLLPNPALDLRRLADDAARHQADERAKNPYLALIPQRPQHTSAFREKKAHVPPPGANESTLPPPPDPSTGAHAWVLVLPGRRDVVGAVYVEPSTGVTWEVKGSHPYRQVEQVWNDENCWVNVQPGGVQAMAWDFDSPQQWLPVMAGGRVAGDKGVKTGVRREEEGEVAEEKEALPPPSSTKQTLHLPASWVAPLTLTRDQWLGRYPSGHKRTVYAHCTVDRWSPYLPGQKGLVLRLEETGDDGAPTRVEERYEHRRDRLVSRVRDCLEGWVTCRYDPGLSSGLREYRVLPGVRREFGFYEGSRMDGLVERVEACETKVVERYQARDDRLTYRSLTVDRTGQAALQRQKAFSITIGTAADLPIRKLTEKYSPDPALHAERDVVKRVHMLLEGLIVLRYACCEGRLEGSEWVIDKNDKLESTEGGGGQGGSSRGRLDRKTQGWKELTRGEEQLMMGRLLIVEKELKVKLKEREARMSDLVRQLDGGEGGELVEDVYHAAYNAAVNAQQVQGGREDDEEGEGATSSPTSDYLTPFLLAFHPQTPLTRKQAEQVRVACLTALKERLLSRAGIIQAHLEDEQTKLQSRQSQFKRQAGSGSMEANEEFQAFSEACLFRIDILLARRARHEQMALKKYAEMEHMLSKDARLQSVYHSE